MWLNKDDKQHLTGSANSAGSSGNANNSGRVHYKDEIARLSDLLTRLSTKVEMLEAKEEAQKELRELTSQKFDNVTGQIGEIRELFKVLSSEKKELEVKIGQTIEQVRLVQPTQIIKQMTGFAHQLSLVDGKIQLVVKQYDSFKKEFEKFDRKLKVFKGEDELLKLQTRVKQDLDDVSKVSHQASLHASKIENHFIKINEKATALQNGIVELKGLKETLLQLQADLTKEREAQEKTTPAAATPDVQTTAISEKIKELEETVGGLADLTSETFTKLKADVAANKSKGMDGVTPAQFEKMYRWVLYLVKENQASKVNGR